MPKDHRAHRASSRRRAAAAGAVAGLTLAGWGGRVSAVDYTYTSPNTNLAAPGDSWNAGTGWGGGNPPQSGTATTLIFIPPTTSAISHNTNNDIGPFQLNVLTLGGATPNGNSAAATLGINGAALQFVADVANPVVSLNTTTGTGSPAPTITVNVNNPITLSNDLTFQGASAGLFNFAGPISGTAAVTKTGNSNLNLSGANTFANGMTIGTGTGIVRIGVGNVGSVGSITSGPFGTGTLVLNGGGVSASNTANARTILNPVTYGGNVVLGSTVNTAALTFAAAGTLTASRTLTVNSTVNYDGDLGQTAAAALTKAGPGLLVINGTNNTYTGGTTISGGVLQFGSLAAVPGTGLVTINSGGALAAAGAYPTVTGALGSGKVAAGSAGAVALTASSSENIDVAGFANLMLGATAAVNYTGTLTPVADAYRLGGGGGTLTLPNANALTGARSLTVGASGSVGTVSLTNANDYTGTTTVNSGVLRVANSAALGAAGGAVATNGTTVASGAALWLDGTGLDIDENLSLVGDGFNSSTTPGVLRNVNGNNTVDGDITIPAGASNNRIASDGGTLTINGDISVENGQLVVQGNGHTTINGVISSVGARNLAKSTSGTGTLTLTNANTYTGATTIGAGTVVATVLADGGEPSGIGASAADATNFTLGGNTFRYAGPTTSTNRAFTFGNNATFESSGAGPLTITGNPSSTGTSGTTTLVLGGTNAGDNTLGGNLVNGTGTNSVAISKTGVGTWVLTGTNNYTGVTTITGGTLRVGSGGLGALTATASVTAQSGGTLGGSGSITTAGGVSVNLGGRVAPGDNAIGTLSITGNVTFGTGGTGAAPIYLAELGPGDTADLLDLTGALTLTNNDTLNLLTANTGTFTIAEYASVNGTFNLVQMNSLPAVLNTDYTISYGANALTVTVLNVVPEPASAGLLGVGALGLLARRRRRA